MSDLVKKLTVPFIPMLMLTIVAGLVGGAQLLVRAAISENTKVGQVSCVAVGYNIGTDKRIYAELTCDGKPGFLGDAQTTLVFIKNPGPHTCTLFESKRADCE